MVHVRVKTWVLVGCRSAKLVGGAGHGDYRVAGWVHKCQWVQGGCTMSLGVYGRYIGV